MFSVRGAENICSEILYLILAEKLFTLPAANEMLPLSAPFAAKYRNRMYVCGELTQSSQ